MASKVSLQSHIGAVRTTLRTRGRALVQTTGTRLQTETQARAPVATGRLRASYAFEMTGALSGEVTSEVAYAAYQEFGTVHQRGTPHVGPGAVATLPVLEAGLPGLFDG